MAPRGIRPVWACAGCTRAVGRAAWRASADRTFARPGASGVGAGLSRRLGCASLLRSRRGVPRVAALTRCPGRGIRAARGGPSRGGARVRWASRWTVPWCHRATISTPLVAPHNTPPRVCPLWRRWPRRGAPRASAGRGVQGLAARRPRTGRQPALREGMTRCRGRALTAASCVGTRGAGAPALAPTSRAWSGTPAVWTS